MKLRELFEKTQDLLYEMAFSRKEVESRITDLSDPVVEHLIKILKWDDKMNYQKHCRDIDTWIMKIQRLQISGSKRPKQRDYYQWMCLDILQNITNVCRWIRVLYKYHQLKVIRTDEEVFNQIEIILSKISVDLAHNKFETIEDYL